MVQIELCYLTFDILFPLLLLLFQYEDTKQTDNQLKSEKIKKQVCVVQCAERSTKPFFIKNILMLKDKQVLQEWKKTQQEYGELYHLMIKQNNITLNDKTLRFQYQMIGQKPPEGYSLVFGLHGGGGCPTHVNDQQYKNHLALYNNHLPSGVIWIALRSCQEASDMWWKSYLPDFLAIIIRGFVLKWIVDPRKIFVTGYSAGGDGVYHLGPMLADWLAGAAMMAGHPNGVQLYSVRNTAFSIQVGGQDGAYNRNNLARQYIQKMKQLSKQYGGFSTRYCRVHEHCAHWMGMNDCAIFPQFFKEEREPYPSFILFKQHPRYPKPYFYYIQVDSSKHKELIIVCQKANEFHIESEQMTVSIHINHLFVDFSKDVKVYHNKVLTVNRMPERKSLVITKSIDERMDPDFIFEDCLVSSATTGRVPLEYGPSQIASENLRLEKAVAQQRRKRDLSQICCEIM